MMTDAVILGAGTWGTALARVLANAGHSVTVWSPLEAETAELSRTRRHPHLGDAVIPESIVFTTDISVVGGARDVIVAVPSPFMRSTMADAAKYMHDGQNAISVAKGIEKDSLLFMSEIIADELGKAGKTGIPVVALSGPTHAEEVVFDTPTTIISASDDPDAAKHVQNAFAGTCMRVYTGTDVRGTELCGAVKNVIALAAGIIAGLGYGDNTRAALITRGMSEITRLGIAMGCDTATFYGLAGIGDLIVTATSRHSRNNSTGFLIGRGMSVDEAIKSSGMVVEGINALPAVMALSAKYGVEMPITNAVNDVINNGKDPHTAIAELMARSLKAE